MVKQSSSGMVVLSLKLVLLHLAPAHLARRLAEQLPACESTFYPGEGHTGPLTKHMDVILAKLAAAGRGVR